MGRLDLKLLGPPEAHHEGRPLRFRARKSLALLAYLATEGGTHRREKLVDLFWPRSDEARGRAALRSALAGLRGTLSEAGEPPEGPYLLAEGNSLSLRSGPGVYLDLRAIEAASQAQIDGAALAGLRDAAEAYRGAFLEGFSLDDAPEFDHWVDGERETWRRRAGLVHARLARLELDGGLPEEAATTAKRWLNRAPADEAVGALLMEARFALGDGEVALETYEAVRRALAEVGTEPGPTIEGLAASIRASSSGPRRTDRSSAQAGLPRGLPDLPLVGRSEEFGALVEEYHSVCEEGARVVAVAGEAGIGKTRLVEEFLHWARAEGAEVLRGGALETRGRLPYDPVVGTLRPRVERERAPDDLLSDLWLSELSRLLPELLERYPDLPAPTADEALAQARLFEAVARLVGALAERAPIVLFLDDLQWADAGTLDLLRHAARRWSEDGATVLLVAGIRSEALDSDEALSQWVSWLVRDRRARRLELETLGGGDISRLLEASVEGPKQRSDDGASGGIPDSLARFGGWLLEETNGQPFFLTETLRALWDRDLVAVLPRAGGGWALDVSAAMGDEDALRGMLPPGVHEVLRVRLSHLSPRASEALSAGAVLGQRFGFEQLLRVAGLEEDEGLELLEEAERARLLREADTGEDDPLAAGYYAFSHGKIWDVAYTEAGSARRRVLHRRALEALEGEGAPSAELARHALGAGRHDAAFRYSLAAGDEAMSLFAIGDAGAHYERARSLLRGGRRKAPVKPSPSEAEHLHVNLGRTRELAGRWEEAKEAYEELRARGRETGETRLEWVALNRLAILAALHSHDLEAASALIREALAVTEAAGDRAASAETRWNLAQMAALGWRTDVAIPLAQDALSVARELGNQELAARCLYTLGFASAYAGLWEECLAHAQEAATLYQSLEDRPAHHSPTLGATFMWAGLPPSSTSANRAMVSLSLSGITMGETNLGRPGKGEEPGRRSQEIARELSNPAAEASTAMVLHYALSETGSYEEALRVAREAVEAARRVGERGGMGSTGLITALVALGNALHRVQDLDGAREAYMEVEAVAEAAGQPRRLTTLTRLCTIRGMTGDWRGAYDYAKVASVRRKEMPSRLFMWDFWRHHEVEALLRGGDEELAREEVELLGEAVGENRRFRLVHLRMQAVLARWSGKPEGALKRLREAHALADEMGLPGESWEIHAAIGDLQDERGEHEEAREAFGRAAETVLTLADRIGDEDVRRNVLSAPPVRHVLGRR